MLDIPYPLDTLYAFAIFSRVASMPKASFGFETAKLVAQTSRLLIAMN